LSVSARIKRDIGKLNEGDVERMRAMKQNGLNGNPVDQEVVGVRGDKAEYYALSFRI
jgi:hypothetical protein